jgi:glycosyltransferase involved in cell wall biosynthesis
MSKYPGKLALQQRALPLYRGPFLEMLAAACDRGLSVFAGKPRLVEGIASINHLNVASYKPGRNLHFLNPSSRFYLCWQSGLVRWLGAWNPDALVVEANPRYLSTPLAVRWMHQRGKPVLGWGLGVPRTGNPIELFLRRNLLSSLDSMIAYSQRGAEEYRTLGLKNVTVAHNAVSPRPKGKPPIRSDVKVGKPVVLFVGRLQARKRIDILLNACRDLPDDLKPELVIVGDGPARSDFQDLAAKVYPAAVFTGAVHGVELDPFYEKADLFALPGTGGLAVQQAMARGLPVIVAQGDGTQDDLVRPENGWQIPPGNQEGFTAVLRDALYDLPRLREMGAESFRIVFEEINLETMVTSFVEALKNTQVLGDC